MMHHNRIASIIAANFCVLLLTLSRMANGVENDILSEKQLTFGSLNKDLDNDLNFSPDGTKIVFDFRDERGINENPKLGYLELATGKIVCFYEQKSPLLGVGAASFLNNHEVVAIHVIAGHKYDFTERGGMIIPIDGSGRIRWLDSRNISAPFTPGALRGGTHKHEPDPTGKWVGFTYNDYIMKFKHGSDLRNVGVSHIGQGPKVPLVADGSNCSSTSFSVLLTAAEDHPEPGSDAIQRAEGDCWIGKKGYLSNGKYTMARAFRGTVLVNENGNNVPYMDVFAVDLPPDIHTPGPLGPLEGTEHSYPKPSKGTVIHRLTRTASNPDSRIRGINGHIRSSGDGKWIAYIGKVLNGDLVETQVFCVSPSTCHIKQLSIIPGGVVSNPLECARFSSNSAFVAVAGIDGAVWMVRATDKDWGHARRITHPNATLPSNIAISPDCSTVVFNRTVNGIKQIFSARVPK